MSFFKKWDERGFWNGWIREPTHGPNQRANAFAFRVGAVFVFDDPKIFEEKGFGGPWIAIGHVLTEMRLVPFLQVRIYVIDGGNVLGIHREKVRIVLATQDQRGRRALRRRDVRFRPPFLFAHRFR